MRKFELTAPNAFVRRATIIDDPVLVEARLQALHPDLNGILLKDAIRGGLGGRNEVTRASAPTAAGVQQWLKTVEDLRTLLAALQWHVHEQQNCPFISSPDRSISIVVMTGNSETGKNGFEDPTNQAEKGAVAENFVQRNSQLELFNRDSFKLAKEKQKETQVWALLYHYDKVLNEVRFELSLPTGFDNKKITEWGVRLILGRIPNNPADFTIRKDAPNAPATVEVKPKTGTF
jgi:GR25 family glycosyltransferase involved in LPS biosynthesis